MEYPAVCVAASSGNLEEVMRLVQSRPNIVHDRNLYQETPLHVAAMEGHVDVCTYLIDQGAHINSEDDCGNTPLALACSYHKPKVVEVLVGRGADPSLADVFESTPLMACITSHKDRHEVRLMMGLLLKHGASIDAQDGYRRTALHIATSRGKLDLMRLLLEAGADPTVKNRDGCCPKLVAITRGYPVCVKVLEVSGHRLQHSGYYVTLETHPMLLKSAPHFF